MNDFKYIAPITVLICLCLIAFNAVLYKLDEVNKGHLEIKCDPVLPIFIDDPRLLENFGDGIYILENGFITECEAVE